MLNKKSLRNPSLYILHHAARYLFPLALTPFLAHQFGAIGFADYVVWNACVWTAILFMEYGFFLYAVNEVARSETKEQIENTLSRIVSSKLLLLPIALIVYFVLTLTLGVISRHPAAALFGTFAVIGYGGSFAWYFQGQERAGTAVLVEAVPQTIQFVLVFATIRGGQDLWLAALWQSLAGVGSFSIASVLIARDKLKLRLRLHGVGAAIKGATPFFVERLCFVLYQGANPLFITALSAKEQVAFYSVADKFLQFLAGLSTPLSYALLPIISRHVASPKGDWKLSLRVIGLVSVLTCGLAIVCFLAAPFVIRLLFKASFAPSIPVAQCFCVAACFVSYNACVSNFVLVPGGRARVLIFTSIIMVVVSLSCQSFLLPRFGAMGSAVSRLAAEIVTAIALTAVASRLISRRNPQPLRSDAAPPVVEAVDGAID